ncbi:fungal-specific transcription factor domain-containing protein [Aspergillus spinulosporus]
MSVASRTLYQPFQCLICQSRFTRHENLKRHALLHTRSHDELQLPCDFCTATFSRPDLRKRHMKRKHPEHETRRAKKRVQRGESTREWSDEDGRDPVSPEGSHDGRSPQAGNDQNGGSASVWGDGRSPSISGLMQQALEEPRVDRIGKDVMDLQTLLDTGRIFRPPESIEQHSPGFISSLSLEDGSWMPSPSQISTGCALFFAHVSHFVPFLHQPTFDADQTPLHLLLSMLSLAYQYGSDPDSDAHAPDSGALLSARCFHRARALLTSSSTASPISTVQSYLLLQIASMMYLCSESHHTLQMHSASISLARTSGLMQQTALETSRSTSLTTLWHAFVSAESHKRTLFALHQIDALWYQFLSVPRSISHLEIKHDLPCPGEQWAAASAEEWAHRQLIRGQMGSQSLQYVDAVRRFLSQESLVSLPEFDPYGAINIAQFLISSAREISGWSTMTGMLSIDRFGALRSSLETLHPFICPAHPSLSPVSPSTPRAQNALCPATWQTAMLELQIWSPAHTSGIIQTSISSLLAHSTQIHLSPSPQILCEEITAQAVKPHIDWFLTYLENTVDAEGEAPWVVVYAFKAFLIAWQLVRGGVEGAMGVVGVDDGDIRGAIEWAKVVFSRRRRWEIGRLVLGCLDRLATDMDT